MQQQNSIVQQSLCRPLHLGNKISSFKSKKFQVVVFFHLVEMPADNELSAILNRRFTHCHRYRYLHYHCHYLCRRFDLIIHTVDIFCFFVGIRSMTLLTMAAR